MWLIGHRPLVERQLWAADCQIWPTQKFWRDAPYGSMTFYDERDSGTDKDYRYGYRYRKHSTGWCGTRTGTGVKASGPGRDWE